MQFRYGTWRRKVWDGQRLTLATLLWDAEQLGSLWKTKGFAEWDTIGIPRVGNLWKKGEVVTFEML